MTSASCHTMTNGFAIFCPTGRQQRTFPLPPGGRESTVFLLRLASNEAHSLHFQTEVNGRREESLLSFVSAAGNYIAELLPNQRAGLPNSPASGDGPFWGATTAPRRHNLVFDHVMCTSGMEEGALRLLWTASHPLMWYNLAVSNINTIIDHRSPKTTSALPNIQYSAKSFFFNFF